MLRRILAAVALCALAAPLSAEEAKLTVKVEKAEPPKELSDAIRAVLDTNAMQVSDAKGKLICTVWPAKSLATKKNAAGAKELRYSHVEETTVIGAVKFADTWTDYRKQKIKPGVYTMRLAMQLMDGDHMGTAPYSEFALLSPAAEDKQPALLDLESLYERSSKSTTRKHPGIVLLFPNRKPGDKPVVEAKPKEHVVLSYAVPAKVGDEKSTLGFSLVILGATMSE